MKKRVFVLLILLFMLGIVGSIAETFPCEGIVNTAAVNLRKTPSTKGAKVTQLADNTSVKVLSEASDSSGKTWYSVQTSTGKSGYVLTQYVTLKEENTEISAEPAALPGESVFMDLAVSASCQNYNNVGKSWTQYYELNDVKIENKKAIAEIIPGSSIMLYSRIKEQDSKPDVGTKTTEYIPTQQELAEGFTVEQKVTVTENGGKYSGKSATWTVVFKFTPKK